MGKRAKKKGLGTPARTSAGSRPSSSSPTSSITSSSESSRPQENGDTGCAHGPNLAKLRTQLAKSSVVHCLECAKLKSGVGAAKDRKGKGNKGVRKKDIPLGLLDEKDNAKKLWMCLSCGLVGCGLLSPSAQSSNGVGEVTRRETKQGIVGHGHAWQHWFQLKHPMVMICGEDFQCWCFACEEAHHLPALAPESEHQPTVVDGESESSTPPSRLMLIHESAELIRQKLTDQLGNVVDVPEKNSELEMEDIRLAANDSGCSLVEKPKAPESKRVIRGLLNLGNSCFFNSVMQNLLSLTSLRHHYCREPSTHEGALTSSLRKFFREASVRSQHDSIAPAEAGTKKSGTARGGWSSVDGTYNPKGLFGAICSRAPRFKGFQQHDSHELLRCLLDGLHMEEENARKTLSQSAGGENALRALTKSGGSVDCSKAEAHNQEDSCSTREDQNGRSVDDTPEHNSPVQLETFVEQIFGGQLSSTVTCCECGHSSVVFESFLDLSLPVPPKKRDKERSSKGVLGLQNGIEKRSEAGRYLDLSNDQVMHSQKSSKPSGKMDTTLHAFSSTPSGLGTPLLLLPPTPLNDQNGDYLKDRNAMDNGWLDSMDLGTVSDETGWLDFLDDTGIMESGGISESAYHPSSELVLGCAPRLESEIVFGCAPNPSLLNESAGPSSMIEEGICQTIASSPADCTQFLAALQPKNGVECVDTSCSAENERASDQVSSSEKLLLTMETSEGTDTVEDFSELGKAENLDPRSIGCQEMDISVQLRGGSASEILDWTHDIEGNECRISEQSDESRTRSGQSGVGNNESVPLSDILNGPSGTIILLGPPVNSATDFACSTLEFDEEYGVGSLFEEDETEENRQFGPCPLSSDEARFAGSSAYDDIAYDDVLDLSKIDGRTEWLVSNEERQGDDFEEVSMSLEGCLQIFTRSELLSGENAWACENCTSRYQEKLAGLSAKPSVAMQRYQGRKSIGKGRIDLSFKRNNLLVQAVRKSQINVLQEDATAAEQLSNGYTEDSTIGVLSSIDDCEDKDVNGNYDLATEVYQAVVEGNDLSAHSAEIGSSGLSDAQGNYVPLINEESDSASENDRVGEACEGKPCVDGKSVNSFYTNNSVDPIDLSNGVESMQADDLSVQDRTIMPLETLVEKIDIAVDNNEMGNHKPVVETSPSEHEKKDSRVRSFNSGKASKLKKLKSRKGTSEVKKVIKQDAKKKLLISRSPPVLTIQLKRFAQDMGGRLSKLSGHVAFEENLDLHQFLDPRHANFDCTYRLIGTVEHAGTLKSGHYVAFVRGPPSTKGLKNDAAETTSQSSWYYISDSHVKETNLEAVLQSEAYLLFYERVDVIGCGV